MTKKEFRIGIIGLGTICSGVAKILLKDQKLLSRRAGLPVVLAKVAEKNSKPKIDFKLPKNLLTHDAWSVINDNSIDLVVEVIGGVHPAKEFIETALKNKKQVVTANKELIAKHGEELLALAQANGVNLYFEAAVGGGIPIIQSLTKGLTANNIQKIYGIVNGTTNYILTKMHQEKAEFAAVLKEAQSLGLAEANPTADVDGYDVQYKLAILAAISFDTFVDYKKIYREGITAISARDIEVAEKYNSVIKLLAVGVAHPNNRLELRVHPVLISKDHPLAAVNGAFNAVYVVGDNVDETMFYGRGAGQMPTASAIVGDIVDLSRNIGRQNSCPSLNFGASKKTLIPMTDIFSRFFLRMIVKDEPGVLAAISKIFSKQKVSIRAVQQFDSAGPSAEIVIITHKVKESAVQTAITKIKKLKSVKSVCSLIRAGL